MQNISGRLIKDQTNACLLGQTLLEKSIYFL